MPYMYLTVVQEIFEQVFLFDFTHACGIILDHLFLALIFVETIIIPIVFSKLMDSTFLLS